MTIKQAFEGFMKANPAEYSFGLASDGKTPIATFLINTETTAYHTICFFMEEEGILMVAINLALELSPTEDELVDILNDLNDLNARTSLGHFYWDKDMENVFVKLSQIVRGDGEEMVRTVTDSILMCGVMARDVGNTLG